MTSLLLDNCLNKESQGYRVDKTKLEKTVGLLAQFIDSNKSCELQCLYAINAKIVEIEHAVGCALDIFTCLYDGFIFNKDSFYKWKDDKNPKEQEGKGEQFYHSFFEWKIQFCIIIFTGVTLKSITQFITFLKEEDSGDEN